jgi:hypothetical protein
MEQVAQSKVVQQWMKNCSLIDDDTMTERLKVAGGDKTLVGIDVVDGLDEIRLRKENDLVLLSLHFL